MNNLPSERTPVFCVNIRAGMTLTTTDHSHRNGMKVSYIFNWMNSAAQSFESFFIVILKSYMEY